MVGSTPLVNIVRWYNSTRRVSKCTHADLLPKHGFLLYYNDVLASIPQSIRRLLLLSPLIRRLLPRSD